MGFSAVLKGFVSGRVVIVRVICCVVNIALACCEEVHLSVEEQF